jgi:hypothetical protein
MTKQFQRQIEDFTCTRCGTRVTGDGYTNHCPHCLYSMHVDNNPGDRANACHGLMPPVALEHKGDEWIVTQRCMKCGVEKRCRTRDEDFDAVVKLARTLAEHK